MNTAQNTKQHVIAYVASRAVITDDAKRIAMIKARIVALLTQ